MGSTPLDTDEHEWFLPPLRLAVRGDSDRRSRPRSGRRDGVRPLRILLGDGPDGPTGVDVRNELPVSVEPAVDERHVEYDVEYGNEYGDEYDGRPTGRLRASENLPVSGDQVVRRLRRRL